MRTSEPLIAGLEVSSSSEPVGKTEISNKDDKTLTETNPFS